jgi:hypothetical protein
MLVGHGDSSSVGLFSFSSRAFRLCVPCSSYMLLLMLSFLSLYHGAMLRCQRRVINCCDGGWEMEEVGGPIAVVVVGEIDSFFNY